jgi:hypothetical protein
VEATIERELIEALHEQTTVLRHQLENAHAREVFLRTLLESDPALGREARLIALIEQDRRELDRLRALLEASREEIHRRRPPQRARPVPPIAASRQPAALHARIMAALEAAPDGLTARELESAVGSPTPLKHVLRHLARRGRVVRLGDGKFGVAAAVLVGAVNRNGVAP